MINLKFRGARAVLQLWLMLVLAVMPRAVFADAGDREFTIAVIPDTQNYLDYTHQRSENFPFDANQMFLEQMRYIEENLEANGGEIAFVTSLGDVWQHQTLKIDPDHAARGFRRVKNPAFDTILAPTPKTLSIEMPVAREGFAMIAGKVPFSVVPGNHDFDAMWSDASKPPTFPQDWKDIGTLGVLHVGGLDNFRTVFGAETDFFRDKPWYVASHQGGADSAQLFSAGGYRFLHIGLQFDPPDASIEWASGVIAKYPGLPTIISTHDYMNMQGERIANPIIDGHAVDPQNNNPQMVWDKFIRKHSQIFLVLCGHEHGQAYRVDANDVGFPVHQILADYQSRHQTALDAGHEMAFPAGIGDGWFRLLTFDFTSPEAQLRVRTYSSHYDGLSSAFSHYAQWYKSQEQPQMSDEQFQAADSYNITLAGFAERFPMAEDAMAEAQ